MKLNEKNGISLSKPCFGFFAFVSVVLLVVAGICDIVYLDFNGCERFLTAFSICATLAFGFWITNQGDRLYYPDDRFLGVRLPIVEYVFGFGLVCFLCVYLFSQIHIYKDSAQNPYLVLSNDVVELSSFSPLKIRGRIRLNSRELQDYQNQIFNAFSDLIVPIVARIKPRILPWDEDVIYQELNVTYVEVKKVGRQIQQTFSVEIPFEQYETTAANLKWSALCNVDDCGFQLQLNMHLDMLQKFVQRRFGILEVGDLVISMRMSDPEDLDVPWALKVYTQYNPLPLHYKIDKWNRKVNVFHESSMTVSMVKVDPDAFSCRVTDCIDLLIPTYEQPTIDVETQTEARSFDFNSMWTALIAMVSACIGIFSFVFRNVLPKRFFIWGNKSFREPQELFQSDLVQLISTIEDQIPNPEIELQETIDYSETFDCGRE